ncbi:uncharacterized protein At4g02000-like [Juglans regia]|uniref:Uncharacterized protein At4g02000-like n=1 Tax=Juglans regia TaxID=51240 RepID=A0A6P9E8B9_JUGRE|nr:uncharacterized protein At4g02000-like [Juglans regia]
MRVLGGCPWLFDNHLFVLKDFDGEMQPSKIDFDHACLWIQMLNLPLSYMNKEMGELIGRSLGEVLEVDVQEDGLAWGRCLRVRVECDLRRHLAQGRTIDVDGKTSWVPFQYEKLPRLCFNCGMKFHDKDGCKERDGNSDQYGVWLRALPQMRKGAARNRDQRGSDYNEQRSGSEKNEKGVESERGGMEDVIGQEGEESNEGLKVQPNVMLSMVNEERSDNFAEGKEIYNVEVESKMQMERRSSNTKD